MKKALVIIITVLFAQTVFASEDMTSMLSNLIYGNGKSEWAIQIETQAIYIQELEAAYELYREQLESQTGAIGEKGKQALKKAFLETFIQQNIIARKAFEEEIFSDPSVQVQMKVLLMQNIYQVYLNHVMKEKNPDLEPSSDEINQFYQANKQQLSGLGLTAQQMQQTISLELSKKKLNLWINNIINQTRESYRIKRNTNLLKKKGYGE